METIETELKRERLWNKGYLKAMSANFMLYFSFMLLTPLLPVYLSDRFNADKDTIGLVLSGYVLATLLIRPFSGYIVDSFPRKKVLLLFYSAFVLLCAGYLVAGTLVAFAIVRTLHGFPFGATTVSNSTVAIDVLPSSRRTEGIGFYGLSGNIAVATAPSVALFIYGLWANFDFLFLLALAASLIGLGIASTLHLRPRPLTGGRPRMSFDRFVLKEGFTEGASIICFSFSYGIVSTYIAIYGQQELGIVSGTGVFFLLFSTGLILSRIVGNRTLRKGLITQNASLGIIVSLTGYLIFASIHNLWGYYGAALIIGLGNGHMYPAFQNIFINLAHSDRRGTANSTLLVSWDSGLGLGTLLGGIIAQHQGFHAAFWWAWAVNGLGALIYFARGRRHYLAHRVR